MCRPRHVAAVPAAPAAARTLAAPAAARRTDIEGLGSAQFGGPVHGVKVSNNGLVYVADRPNRRVQVFTPEGKYVTQVFINRTGPSAQSAAGVAFSPDAQQQFLYVADYGNSHIAVLDRKSLQLLYQFGERSEKPGDFQGLHHMAVDSRATSTPARSRPARARSASRSRGCRTRCRPTRSRRSGAPPQTAGPRTYPRPVQARGGYPRGPAPWPTRTA